jgi:hypothetical protein
MGRLSSDLVDETIETKKRLARHPAETFAR